MGKEWKALTVCRVQVELSGSTTSCVEAQVVSERMKRRDSRWAAAIVAIATTRFMVKEEQVTRHKTSCRWVKFDCYPNSWNVNGIPE